MIIINGKEFRNLEEQVQKNKEDIAAHYNVDRVLADFGIRIIGQVDNSTDLPTEGTFEYGDAYAVGTEEPYSFWIWTRADINSGHPYDYWFNVGDLAIVGPQGPQGEIGATGPQGIRGGTWYSGSAPMAMDGLVNGDMWLVTQGAQKGQVYRYYDYAWSPVTNIMGPQGIQGPQGLQGLQGERGAQGPQGKQGPQGDSITILDILSSVDELPSPESVGRNEGYLIGTGPYDFWIITGSGDTLQWTNAGAFSVGSNVTVNGEPVKVFNADTKLDNKAGTTASRAYVVDGNGNNTMLFYSILPSAGAYSLVQRTTEGNISVPLTPTSNTFAASKAYVDNVIAGRVQSVTEPTYSSAVYAHVENPDTGNYEDTVIQASDLAIAGAIPLRTSVGSIPVPTLEKSNAYRNYAVNQTYVSNELANYAPLATDTSDYDRAITIGANGQIKYVSMAQSRAPGFIVVRGTGGNVLVPQTPSGEGSATAKVYVDNLVATKVTAVATPDTVYAVDSTGAQTNKGFRDVVSPVLKVKRTTNAGTFTPVAGNFYEIDTNASTTGFMEISGTDAIYDPVNLENIKSCKFYFGGGTRLTAIEFTQYKTSLTFGIDVESMYLESLTLPLGTVIKEYTPEDLTL